MKQQYVYAAAFAGMAAVMVVVATRGTDPVTKGPVATATRRLVILKQPSAKHYAGKAIPLQIAVHDDSGKPLIGPDQPTVTLSIGANSSATTLHGTTIVKSVDGLIDLNAGATSFGPRQELAAPSTQILGGAATDLNGDDHSDLVLLEATRLQVFFTKSDGTLAPVSSAAFGFGGTPVDVKLADMDGDGLVDAIVAMKDPAYVQVFKGVEDPANAGQGKGDFVAQPVHAFNDTVIASIVLADLNEDGAYDLAVGDAKNAVLRILLNDGKASFTEHAKVPTGKNPAHAFAKDLDHDGNMDLLVADEGGVTIIRGLGKKGELAAPFTLATGSPATAVACGDFDLDGKPDVLALVPANGVQVFRNANAQGSLEAAHFTPWVSAPPLAGAKHFAAADLDSDGHFDLAVVVADGSLHVLFGDGATLAARSTTLATKATRVLIADFTGDHLLDLVPLGLETKAWVNQGPSSIVNVAPNIRAAGTYTLVVSSPGLESVTTTPFEIEGDPSTDPIVIECSEITPGGPFSVTVTLTDEYGLRLASSGDRIYVRVNGEDAGSVLTTAGHATIAGLRARHTPVRITCACPAKELTRTRIGSAPAPSSLSWPCRR